ncbi:DUF3194 domain-containing protein [Methanobacterium congolense]|uniref:DUF3194 domain-containing protein n=1 Tax=Methanobacterium congolense TaxID=118062 RepID=A0A1D3L0D9_9EURY|nr:DUF3194 domain-containing protein [Methanobacterium congolense]SCG85055.1 putative protein MTH_677 [Methanobacterium congolense]
MSKLKRLSSEDLDTISEFTSSAAENFIFKKISKKEVMDFNVDVEMDYEDELNVDVEVHIVFDELSNASNEMAQEAVDHALEELGKFLDDKYRT